MCLFAPKVRGAPIRGKLKQVHHQAVPSQVIFVALHFSLIQLLDKSTEVRRVHFIITCSTMLPEKKDIEVIE
jgi:hypothetical protein